ncbi:LemA family protein [Runella rosea]|uniref:LemA family protein n=1 Tax=Runella rosea TaxID=2259595 RepID=A0A344TRZ0_9BACT|nr:LemA family protein [Runella rosea]AXE21411.1 LemA family protein [Runella rosea]
MNPFYIILSVAALLLIGGIAIYNGLVSGRALVDEAWSGISVQLKRRFDLIPNLVTTVKGYAKHESETLEKVIQLRNAAVYASPLDVSAQAQASAALSQGLRSVFALAENYPDLKANQNFADLQAAVEKIEDDLQNSRRYYNATVRDYNTKCDSFPSNLVAGLFHFSKKMFFELANPEESQNVKISF